MKWLMLATVVVLPSAAILASQMSYPAPQGRLPRLIEARTPSTGAVRAIPPADARSQVARE
jgi:hypothetical protein